TMAETPGAMQLRLLQTVADVAAEKNSTLVMPFPVELLRFFEHATEPETEAEVGTESAPPTAGPPALTPLPQPIPEPVPLSNGSVPDPR
ncbi:MAG: hypothetical protein QOE59_5102, partial [Actinomycetota bacterium]|nr:hypothetical protein [Actinomycetota bacterium]